MSIGVGEKATIIFAETGSAEKRRFIRIGSIRFAASLRCAFARRGNRRIALPRLATHVARQCATRDHAAVQPPRITPPPARRAPPAPRAGSTRPSRARRAAD
ncbi:hypothetical protein CO709_23700 [Burkholderia thailandensis]|nr:hypothetical protein CO709_23700 [Burkholderia thailandensis]